MEEKEREPDEPEEPLSVPFPLGDPLEPILDGPEPVTDPPEPERKR